MSEPDEWQAMAAQMLDETLVTQDLITIREGMFRTQFKQSFKYAGGPKNWWAMLESEWATLSGGQPIPTKYRTNKSVILKAWRHDTAPQTWRLAKTGEWLGKTAVQELCRKGKDSRFKIPEAMFKSVVAGVEAYDKVANESDVAAFNILLSEWIKDRL